LPSRRSFNWRRFFRPLRLISARSAIPIGGHHHC
jgi:hypothetical protein